MKNIDQAISQLKVILDALNTEYAESKNEGVKALADQLGNRVECLRKDLHSFVKLAQEKAEEPREIVLSKQICPACSSYSTTMNRIGMRKCQACGAKFGEVPYRFANDEVRIDEPMVAGREKSGVFHFDFTIPDYPGPGKQERIRIHGFADVNTLRVVQIG